MKRNNAVGKRRRKCQARALARFSGLNAASTRSFLLWFFPFRGADGLSGGAQHGADLFASSLRRGGFQTVREPVLRSERRTLRAARSHMTALKERYRRFPLAQSQRSRVWDFMETWPTACAPG